MPQIKTDILKFEIIKNLPYVKIERYSLYIHIRGGDAFINEPHSAYAQPPLCFYEKIINNNNFKNIYIISMDKENIIVSALMNKYKRIIYTKNKLEFDISLLVHAYYIVISVSSFSLSSIKLNDNLKDLWECDMIKLSEKIYFLHHHLFKFKIKYKIHTMRPSDRYISKMFLWKRSYEQIKLMFEEDCPNDFVITKPNI